MAQFRKLKGKRGTRHQAVIDRRGHYLTRTFSLKNEAQEWAREVERAIDVATDERPFVREAWTHASLVEATEKNAAILLADAHERPSIHWTLKRALDHYRDTVTVKKKGELQERNRIKLIQKYGLANLQMGKITDDDLEQFREERQAGGATAITITKDLFLISGLFRIAALKGMDQRHEVRGWGLTTLTNPVKLIKLAKPGSPRRRRFRNAPGNQGPGEEQRIMEQLRQQAHGTEMVSYVMFSVATAMRRSEILKLTRESIIDEGGTTMAFIPKGNTKNDDERRVVLNRLALQIAMQRMEETDPGQPLIPLSVNQITHLWRKARKAIGSPDLRMHDLRHEGLSRMASAGLHIGELQRQSGHRNARTLAETYLNGMASDIARKLG